MGGFFWACKIVTVAVRVRKMRRRKLVAIDEGLDLLRGGRDHRCERMGDRGLRWRGSTGRGVLA